MVVGRRMREELSQKLSRESQMRTRAANGGRIGGRLYGVPPVRESCTRWSSPCRVLVQSI